MKPEQTIREVEPRVREYQPEDAPALLAMLEAEGIKEEETTFTRGVISVLAAGDEIIGFSMLEVLGPFAPEVLRLPTPELYQNYVHLKHFCIALDHRSNQSNAWELIRYIHDVVWLSKYGQMIVHAKGNRMIRIAWAYFRTRPYDQAEDGTAFFLVNI
jgi:hypothetical protein